MKLSLWPIGALSVFCGSVLLAGCGQNGAVGSAAPSLVQSVSPLDAFRVQPNNYANRLYISDSGANGIPPRIDRLGPSPTFNWVGLISTGVPCPAGAWESRGALQRLYVANFGCNPPVEVSEHKPNGALVFTYTTSLIDPLNVSTDGANNVYVADYGGAQVVEFAQQSNVVLNHCGAPYVSGVAINSTGDVFILSYGTTNSMTIIKYPGPAGLANCAAGTPIGATFPPGDAGGALLTDNNDNLVVCDQNGGIYKVHAPGYTNVVLVPGTGAYQCRHMSLNNAASHLFFTEPGKSPPDVQVIHYPSGVPVVTLTPAPGTNQIHGPQGVAPYPG